MKREPHERVVSGLFESRDEAHHAIEAMDPIGLDSEDISIITSQVELEAEEYSDFGGLKLHDEAVHAAKRGMVAGALLAGCTALAAMIIGGETPIATILIVAVATGAGSILGTLLAAGFTDEESKVIDMGLSQGKVVLAIHTMDRSRAKRVEKIMKERRAKAVHHY